MIDHDDARTYAAAIVLVNDMVSMAGAEFFMGAFAGRTYNFATGRQHLREADVYLDVAGRQLDDLQVPASLLDLHRLYLQAFQKYQDDVRIALDAIARTDAGGIDEAAHVYEEATRVVLRFAAQLGELVRPC